MKNVILNILLSILFVMISNISKAQNKYFCETQVSKMPVAASIISDLADSTICFNSTNVFLFIKAEGDEPISYQWQKDGVDISNTDNDTLHFNNIKLSDAAQYRCIVSNNCGSDTSFYTKLYVDSSTLYSSIVGVAKYSNGFIGNSDAEVTIFDTSFNPYIEIQTVEIEENGCFKFDSILIGNYIISINIKEDSIVEYPNVMQTYFDSVTNWENATSINIIGETIDTIIVNMYESVPFLSGQGNISGVLNYSSISNKSGMAQPVVNAKISLAKTNDNLPVLQTHTLDDGSYQFLNVPLDDYTLQIEIPGIPQISTYNFVLSESVLLFENLNFIVDTNLTELGIYKADITNTSLSLTENQQISIYPNPSSEYINIDYNFEENSPINIELINIQGKVLNSQKPENSLTENSIKLNVENIENGIYFVKIESRNTIYIKKISIVK